MKKGSFILYDADLDGLDYLTDVQAGKLFKAIRNYRLNNDKSFVSKNPAVNILYSQITGHISLNEEKYNATCEKRSETMKKRWSEKKTSEVNYSALQSNIVKGSPLSDNDNDNENVNDNDNVNENKNDIVNDNATDACGAKRENKRKNYSKKQSYYSEDEPICDTELMKQRVLERYRNMMNQSEA